MHAESKGLSMAAIEKQVRMEMTAEAELAKVWCGLCQEMRPGPLTNWSVCRRCARANRLPSAESMQRSKERADERRTEERRARRELDVALEVLANGTDSAVSSHGREAAEIAERLGL